MSNFEKKFGKYAIRNLTLVLIVCYAIGYLFETLAPAMMNYLYLDVYQIIHHFQIWRLFTWIIAPPGSFSFWTLIMLYFYYSLGSSLERTWGVYKYNLYLFSGILFTVAGAFLLYLGTYAVFGDTAGAVEVLSRSYSQQFSTYYINMSIFLAFAATFPDAAVFLFFFIPIKVKYLGMIYGAMLVYEFVTYLRYSFTNIAYFGFCVVIIVSLLNFVVFFLMQRKKLIAASKRMQDFTRAMKRARDPYNMGTTSSQREFQSKPQNAPKMNKVTRHKCAICGKTDISDPDMSFRFCSKCNGNYEYCEEHLFTHKHVE